MITDLVYARKSFLVTALHISMCKQWGGDNGYIFVKWVNQEMGCNMAHVNPSQHFLKSLEASLEERKEDATFSPLNSACVSEFFLTEEKGGES